MDTTTSTGAQPAPSIPFPLQPGIALERAVAAVDDLATGNAEIDTSIEHLGVYSSRVEWLRQQVLITRGRP